MDRSQRTWGCMGCTIPVLRRSSGPFRPVRCHRILAFHSPPSITAHRHTLLTTGQTSGLVLCPRHGLGRVRTRASAASPDAAGGQIALHAWAERPTLPDAQACPVALRNRKAPVPIQEAPARSAPHRARSSAPGLAVLFHRILAFHPPPSVCQSYAKRVSSSVKTC